MTNFGVPPILVPPMRYNEKKTHNILQYMEFLSSFFSVRTTQARSVAQVSLKINDN